MAQVGGERIDTFVLYRADLFRPLASARRPRAPRTRADRSRRPVAARTARTSIAIQPCTTCTLCARAPLARHTGRPRAAHAELRRRKPPARTACVPRCATRRHRAPHRRTTEFTARSRRATYCALARRPRIAQWAPAACAPCAPRRGCAQTMRLAHARAMAHAPRALVHAAHVAIARRCGHVRRSDDLRRLDDMCRFDALPGLDVPRRFDDMRRSGDLCRLYDVRRSDDRRRSDGLRRIDDVSELPRRRVRAREPPRQSQGSARAGSPEARRGRNTEAGCARSRRSGPPSLPPKPPNGQPKAWSVQGPHGRSCV